MLAPIRFLPARRIQNRPKPRRCALPYMIWRQKKRLFFRPGGGKKPQSVVLLLLWSLKDFTSIKTAAPLRTERARAGKTLRSRARRAVCRSENNASRRRVLRARTG